MPDEVQPQHEESALIIGYAHHDAETHTTPLRAAGAIRCFTDLTAALRFVRAGDTLVSTIALPDIADDLERRGVALVVREGHAPVNPDTEADSNGDLPTCGLMTTLPHVAEFPAIGDTDAVGVAAMRKIASDIESPHVPKTAGRDYLRPDEVNAVINAAAKVGRNGVRDQVLLRLMYRHGLRASEARHVRWTDFDLDHGRTFHVRRLKGSADSMHQLDRDELSALRKMRDAADSPFVFTSERGGPISPDMIARIVERAAGEAGLGFHVHPHMLRHSAGYMLANEGTDTRLIQDFLGHKNIQHTVRYTQLSAKRLASVRVR